MGNYRGVGDTKFIPYLFKHKLQALVVNSQAFESDPNDMTFIWDQIKDRLFSLRENELSLGFSPNV